MTTTTRDAFFATIGDGRVTPRIGLLVMVWALGVSLAPNLVPWFVERPMDVPALQAAPDINAMLSVIFQPGGLWEVVLGYIVIVALPTLWAVLGIVRVFRSHTDLNREDVVD